MAQVSIMTTLYDWKKTIKQAELDQVSELLQAGKLVIFPTETVYGIGANAYNKNAVEQIFTAKGRANDNPLIVHIADFSDLEAITEPATAMEQALMDAFMPGPFTLILKKKAMIPDNVSAGLDTIGVRMPANPIAHALIQAAKIPIAAPSANLSGRPSGTRVADIYDEFDGNVAAIIDGGDTEIGIESTVVKVIDGIPTILRPGKVTPMDIKEVVGVVKIDEHIFKKAEGIVASPGMKYKHYAPQSNCLLVYSDDEEMQIALVNEHLVPNTIVIGFEEHRNRIRCHQFYAHGHKGHEEEISHSIFQLLRQVDQQHPAKIIIEGVKKEGLGLAIMNRLIRAASYQYIEK